MTVTNYRAVIEKIMNCKIFISVRINAIQYVEDI